MENVDPQCLARRPFRLVKHMVCCVSVFGHVFLRAFKTRAGALLRPSGLPRATFRATTKNTAVRRDWRSVWGPFWPKWASRSRRVHIFKKFVFSSFSKFHAIRRVLRSLVGSWASPGTLWGGPGGQQPDQGHGHSEASCLSCFAVAGGRPIEHQTAKHDGKTCRKPSSRQVCVQKPS